ncbi:hypothetical protein VII00023_00135 [Vibrio ichthyoenteri ATCC 700023]|uniref:Uncharacterized protein n=2 Tax=Vibrio ichthyoenteri TaxID=142461 RepID=F9S1C9_9VIBR|nr:hypothetical protein VII00023_00135 [Vibrio ichthyoenteri ATCC 700023]
MNDLANALIAIGADQLDAINSDSTSWQSFCQNNEELFHRVQLAKPDQALTHHLLGILTKSHIEALSRVEQQRESVQAMDQAIQQHIGAQYGGRFQYQEGEQLLVVTHLWLYVQGYLGMDFSLANDHAQSSVQALVAAQGGDVQAMRSDLMASFYQGKAYANRKPNKRSMLGSLTLSFTDWLKSLFK